MGSTSVPGLGAKDIIDIQITVKELDDHQEWKKLLHHFYDPFPAVEHYQLTQNYPASGD
jgi:GrpB-like predicted nucleotidyltransferase (UPF0157 family)